MPDLRTQIVNIVRQNSVGEKACAEHEVVHILANGSRHDPEDPEVVREKLAAAVAEDDVERLENGYNAEGAWESPRALSRGGP